MKSDEYSYLDVFDLTNKKPPKKEVNAWKLMVNYLKMIILNWLEPCQL